MTKKPSVKTSNFEKYAKLNLHELEEVIAKLNKSSAAGAADDLRAARKALSARQHIIKASVMEFEQENNHHLLFFDSTNGFCKLAGHSVLIFSQTISERIHWRYTRKTDTDRYSVSEDGIISIRDLDRLAQLLLAVNIFPDKDLSTPELHYYKLTKVYSEAEISKFRSNLAHIAEQITATILPRSPLPDLYDAIKAASDIIYHKLVVNASSAVRDTIGTQLARESYELTVEYLEFARTDSLSSLARLIQMTHRLRNGMAYISCQRLIDDRDTNKILEQLIIIDRISTKTYRRVSKSQSNRQQAQLDV